MAFHRLRTRLFIALCLLALVGLFGGLARAGKPGGGGGGGTVPQGTIYYSLGNGSYGSMKADGSGKTQAPSGVPSYQQHGGSRWFLQAPVIDYEDHGVDEWGNPITWEVRNVIAVDEAGNRVTLATARGFDVGHASWGKDDSFISYTSAVDTASGVEGGLFAVELDWSLGSPAPATALPIYQTETFPWGEVNLYAHDWSPTGHAFVFQFYDVSGTWQLSVADFTNTTVETRPLVPGIAAAWSPNGNRIAYARRFWVLGDELFEIWMVNPDDTTVDTRLTQSSATSSSRRSQLSPSWSPDNAHVAFTDRLLKGNNTTSNVLRIPVVGGSTTSLTSNGTSGNPQWRQ